MSHLTSVLSVFSLAAGVSAFAQDQFCGLGQTKPWNVAITSYGEDFEEEGIHPGTYVTKPEERVALAEAAERMSREVTICENICALEKGSFATPASSEKKCTYFSTYPYFWECSIEARASCE